MSLDRLRAACRASKVGRVGFVDDVFDTPEAGQVDRARYAAFARRFNEPDSPLGALLPPGPSGGPPKAPRHADLTTRFLEPLWRHLWKSCLAGADLTDPTLSATVDLFREHGHDPWGMLLTVTGIVRLFAVELGCEVTPFGRAPDLGALVGMDVVLIDFYLEHRLTPERALAQTVELVRRIRASERTKRSSPSFILVSSRPEDVDHERFRREASLLRSRFRFVAKDELGKTTGAHLLDVHDVLEASPQATEIEALIEDWRRGASRAVEDVHRSLLEFDVSDFVYLDCFRLYREGTSLGTYLRWLMTAYLQSKVPDGLDRDTWAGAETLRLFDVEAYPTGNPEVDKLVKAFEGPGQAVGRAYGAILVDTTRSSANPFPVAPTSPDLLEGDMFVKRVGPGADHQGASVSLVMTPSCDLVVRGGETAPAAKTVLFLPGELHRVDGETQPKEIGDVEFVHVTEKDAQGNDATRIYTVTWRPKEVFTLPWHEVGEGRAFAEHDRLGRLREPYFNHVREKFVAGVTRIGREVPPLFPVPRAGEVSIRAVANGKALYRTVLRFEVGDALVWSFPASVRKPPTRAKPAAEVDRGTAGGHRALPRSAVRSSPAPEQAVEGEEAVEGEASEGGAKVEHENETLFHVSRRFVPKLVQALRSSEEVPTEQRDDLLELCGSLDFSLSLLQPGRKGARTLLGRPKTVDVRTGKRDRADQRSSQSTLLIFLFD